MRRRAARRRSFPNSGCLSAELMFQGSSSSMRLMGWSAMRDRGRLDRHGQPSCSAAEALERQEPFLNPTLANHSLALLARLFRYRKIDYHEAFVSLSSLSSVQALRVDPSYWRHLRRKQDSERSRSMPLGP